MISKLFACILMLASSVYAKTPFSITYNSTETTITLYWDDTLVFDYLHVTGNVVELNSPYHHSGINVKSGLEMQNFFPGQTVEIFANATIGNQIYEASNVARTGIKKNQ